MESKPIAHHPSSEKRSATLYKQFLMEKQMEISTNLISALIIEITPVNLANRNPMCNDYHKYLVINNQVYGLSDTSCAPYIVDGEIVFSTKNGFLFDKSIPLIENFTNLFSNNGSMWMIEVRRTNTYPRRGAF